MEDWPSDAGLRGQASNRPELRWLKTVVVSVREKAGLEPVRWGPRRRSRESPGQGFGPGWVSPFEASSILSGIETGVPIQLRDEAWQEPVLLARWCPA